MTNFDEIERRIAGIFGISSLLFMKTGKVEIPCGPGGYAAVIEYDENGPVLDTQFKREEFALAMEERMGGELSDDAIAAYTRRVL